MKDLRTGPRYFLNPPIHGKANGNPVRVVDISTKGARLELRRSMQPGSPVDLEFDSFRIRAAVLWCQVDTLNFGSDYDGYLSGIAFESSKDELEQLAIDRCDRGQAMRIEEMRAHDRYRITAPMTGSFGALSPISIIDLSIEGARIALLQRVAPGFEQTLRFQVDDETGPMNLSAKVMWCKPSPVIREYYAGLEIEGAEEEMRTVIHRLCTRNEARIDMDSLKRKFDLLRLASRLMEDPQSLAV